MKRKILFIMLCTIAFVFSACGKSEAPASSENIESEAETDLENADETETSADNTQSNEDDVNQTDQEDVVLMSDDERRDILDSMLEEGEITQEEYDEMFALLFEEDFTGITDMDSEELAVTAEESVKRQELILYYDGSSNLTECYWKWESDSDWNTCFDEGTLEAGSGLIINVEVKEEAFEAKFVFENGKVVEDSVSWETLSRLIEEYGDYECVLNFSTLGFWDNM